MDESELEIGASMRVTSPLMRCIRSPTRMPSKKAMSCVAQYLLLVVVVVVVLPLLWARLLDDGAEGALSRLDGDVARDEHER